MFIFVVPTLQKQWNEIGMRELAGENVWKTIVF
jgi:hypothetical protein